MSANTCIGTLKRIHFLVFLLQFFLVELGATLQSEPKLSCNISDGPVVKKVHSPSNAEGRGLIPGRGTKTPHAVHCGQKIEEKKKKKNFL